VRQLTLTDDQYADLCNLLIWAELHYRMNNQFDSLEVMRHIELAIPYVDHNGTPDKAARRAAIADAGKLGPR